MKGRGGLCEGIHGVVMALGVRYKWCSYFFSLVSRQAVGLGSLAILYNRPLNFYARNADLDSLPLLRPHFSCALINRLKD